MGLKYEPSSEPLHVYAKQLFLSLLRCRANMPQARLSVLGLGLSVRVKIRETLCLHLRSEAGQRSTSELPFQKSFLEADVQGCLAH